MASSPVSVSIIDFEFLDLASEIQISKCLSYLDFEASGMMQLHSHSHRVFLPSFDLGAAVCFGKFGHPERFYLVVIVL